METLKKKYDAYSDDSKYIYVSILDYIIIMEKVRGTVARVCPIIKELLVNKAKVEKIINVGNLKELTELKHKSFTNVLRVGEIVEEPEDYYCYSTLEAALEDQTVNYFFTVLSSVSSSKRCHPSNYSDWY
uniref:Uncharacterized protein n=1 Tax=viral metagenome TaxID=1070528 RepID=A0A6C0E9Z2_9ZZZZ